MFKATAGMINPDIKNMFENHLENFITKEIKKVQSFINLRMIGAKNKTVSYNNLAYTPKENTNKILEIFIKMSAEDIKARYKTVNINSAKAISREYFRTKMFSIIDKYSLHQETKQAPRYYERVAS
jgi:predicted nucleic acid binding AN1-type Zn finger protein